MTLTDLDVRNIYEAISSVANRPFPFKLSYRLTKIADQLETAYKSTEKSRGNLIKEFDETGLKVPQEKMNEFFEKFNEVLENNSAIHASITPIPAFLFEGLNIEVSVLKALNKVIDENAVKPENA